MADEKIVASSPFKLQLHYIKGSNYREIACHGMFGGPTPQGKLWMSMYSERAPIPRMVEYNLPPPAEGTSSVLFEEGKGGPPSLIEGRQGIIRHVEFSAYVDVDVAEKIHEWLGTQ